MPATYEPIQSVTLASAAASITFSSIPGTFTDLRLVLVGTIESGDHVYVRLNGDAGSNYSYTRLVGNGSVAATYRQTNDAAGIYCGPAAIQWYWPSALSTLDFFSYSGATNKSVLVSTAYEKGTEGAVFRSVALWRSTSAISSMLLRTGAGMSFSAGFTATLYGIRAA